MTDRGIQKVIEEIRPNIKKLAYMFLPKMKQPSTYTLQDLESEAQWVIIHHIRKKGRIDETKGKISTYLIRSVIYHFGDLVKKSYREDPILGSEISESLHSRNVVRDTIRELDLLIHLKKNLRGREMEYIQLLLSPPEQMRDEMDANRKSIRKVVREHMSMLPEEERIVRDSIKTKLIGFRI